MRALFPSPGTLDLDDTDLVDCYEPPEPPGPGRPSVRLNMIASADGAASAGGLTGDLGGPADRLVFLTLRSLADVVVVGSTTWRMEGYGPARLDDRARARRLEQGLPPVPPVAVVTARCRLDWSRPFFTHAELRPLVITVSGADQDDLARAAEVADVIIAGEHQVDLAAAMAALAERGHRNVLSEGGPGLAGQLSAAGVLDELCLTVSPLLMGGEVMRILRGPALVPPVALGLVHVLESEDFLFLRYRVRRS